MKTTKIVPGILEEKLIDIKTKVGLIKDYVSLIQLDICDGLYTKKTTWPYSMDSVGEYNDILQEKDGLPFWIEVNYELDLMVLNAHKKFFSDWIKLGPSKIIFHFDAEEDKESFLNFLRDLDPFYKETIDIGIAIKSNTDISNLSDFIPYVSYIQFMGILNIGMQGQKFDENIIEKVREVKEKFNDLKVTIDGGVNINSIDYLLNLGISRYVSGSYIFKSFDLEETIQELDLKVNL
jgi:ribulose-phosphate 3-epimerase